MYLVAHHKNKAYYLLILETTANKLRLHFIADKSQGLLSRACCWKLHLRVCARVPVWCVCPCALVRGGGLVGFRAAVATYLFVFWMSACCLNFADERPFAHGSWPVNGARLCYGGEPAAISQQAGPDSSSHSKPCPPPWGVSKVPTTLLQSNTARRKCNNSLLIWRFLSLDRLKCFLGMGGGVLWKLTRHHCYKCKWNDKKSSQTLNINNKYYQSTYIC